MPFSVSVVIPTYNRLSFLKKSIESVLNQTHCVDEIIVVDDGSNDGTFEKVKALYPQVDVMIQAHRGVSAARNLGIQKARSSWIALLDSDDIWYEQKIEKQLKALKQNPKAVMCHTDEIWIRNGVRVNPKNKHKKRGGSIYKYCLPLCSLSPSSVIISKKIFNEIGFFDEELPACEDYDLWLRICSRYPVLFIDDLLVVKHGGHNDQLSRNIKGLDRYRIRALEKMISSQILNPDDHRLTIEMLCQKIEIYLKGARKRFKQDEIDYYEEKLNFYLGVLT